MQKYLLATRDDLLAKRNSSAIFGATRLISIQHCRLQNTNSTGFRRAYLVAITCGFWLVYHYTLVFACPFLPADDGCAYRDPPPAPAHLDVRDPFVLVHAHCDPAAIHRDLVRRKQMVLAHVATSVDSMLSTRPKPRQQQNASETATSSEVSTDSSASSTASALSSSTQRQLQSNHSHHADPIGPTGMAWDAADSVRFLTEKRLNAEPVGALPVLSGTSFTTVQQIILKIASINSDRFSFTSGCLSATFKMLENDFSQHVSLIHIYPP